MNQFTNALLVFTQEVKDALVSGKPIVALESNVITHGLDYPQNYETAKAVEQAVRDGGAVPATIGIANGKLLIGMTDDQIREFATQKGIPKVSSRDLAQVLAQGGLGATTVASSLVAAEMAGITFFSSAGIGGVHRGAETNMDISSDLIQFTKSRMTVVCAGAKKILDLGLTLEYLETHNVPVIAYQSEDFPAFYCQSSGFKSPQSVDNAQTLADIIDTYRQLPGGGSVLVTTPTRDEDAIDSDEVEQIIQQAVISAEKEGVVGNGLTKYLMKKVDAATSGRSAQANMAVLINTAKVAGQLAYAHNKVMDKSVA